MRGSPFAFPLAAVAALAVFVISESSYQQARSTFETLIAQGTVRTSMQQLMRALTDAETGQRGYLMTGRADYLKPYNEGVKQVNATLVKLIDYYDDNPQTDAMVKRMEAASRTKLAELSETIKLHDSGGAWRDLVLSDIGREEMETVRKLTEELLSIENDRIVENRASLFQSLMLNRIGVTAMTALSLLALFMFLRQSSALIVQREEQRRLVQAERDQLEVVVARRTDQLTDLARHLQTVREDERMRLARELHDELGALLTAAKLDVARLKSRLGTLTPEVAERIKHLTESLNNGIALKRRIIEDLRPSSLSNLGLIAAIDILLTEWSARSEIPVERDLHPVRLQPGAQLTVYRLVQEALTNITKYAQATRVQVWLTAEGETVRVAVQDNGVGFDTRAPRSAAHGLLGMGYRVESENGRMVLTSAPGQGTLIEAEIPAQPA